MPGGMNMLFGILCWSLAMPGSTFSVISQGLLGNSLLPWFEPEGRALVAEGCVFSLSQADARRPARKDAPQDVSSSLPTTENSRVRMAMSRKVGGGRAYRCRL